MFSRLYQALSQQIVRDETRIGVNDQSVKAIRQQEYRRGNGTLTDDNGTNDRGDEVPQRDRAPEVGG